MGYPGYWRKSVAELELSMSSIDSGNNYITHNASLPFPDFLKDFKYDGIILWSTFLDARHFRSRYESILRDYDFIRESNAIKIALPQDDYYCPGTLDEWMTLWDVDVVYNVIHEQTNLFFNKFIEAGGKVRKGFTGYISEDLLSKSLSLKDFSLRTIDIGYRASNSPLNLNKLAILKSEIAGIFKEKFSTYGLKMDISVRHEDTIYGDRWYDFLQDSKFVISTNSGSSLVIPDLYCREKVENFIQINPGFTYQEIKDKFFKEQNEEQTYTAISPRNIESTLLGACQINTTLGNYSGILLPWEHFIPLKADCSNHHEVYEAMLDQGLVSTLISNSRQALLSVDNLRLKNLVKEILDTISSSKQINSDEMFLTLQKKYKSYEIRVGNIMWSKFWVKQKIKDMLSYFKG
jgi:hypothetical protein